MADWSKTKKSAQADMLAKKYCFLGSCHKKLAPPRKKSQFTKNANTSQRVNTKLTSVKSIRGIFF